MKGCRDERPDPAHPQKPPEPLESKLYELMQDGVLESVHIGTCRRIPTDSLTALVAKLRGAEADAEAS